MSRSLVKTPNSAEMVTAAEPEMLPLEVCTVVEPPALGAENSPALSIDPLPLLTLHVKFGCVASAVSN
jgi:hypothetical protein